jgi:hypothetical protein
MMLSELYDDPAASTDPGLVHLASQFVQLLWLEGANVGLPKFTGKTRKDLLTAAGTLLTRLAEHTSEVPSIATEWGALPSPAALETSGYLLDALREAGISASPSVDAALLGGESYAHVRGKLQEGELPSLPAQEKLMEIFSSLSEVAARRDYRSPFHD